MSAVTPVKQPKLMISVLDYVLQSQYRRCPEFIPESVLKNLTKRSGIKKKKKDTKKLADRFFISQLLDSINPKCQRMRSEWQCFRMRLPAGIDSKCPHNVRAHFVLPVLKWLWGLGKSSCSTQRPGALHKKERVHVRTSSHTAHGRCRMSGCSQNTAPRGLTFTFLQRCNAFFCVCCIIMYITSQTCRHFIYLLWAPSVLFTRRDVSLCMYVLDMLLLWWD